MEDPDRYYSSYLYKQLFESKEPEEPLTLNLKQANKLRIEPDMATIKYTGKGLHSTGYAVTSKGTASRFKRRSQFARARAFTTSRSR